METQKFKNKLSNTQQDESSTIWARAVMESSWNLANRKNPQKKPGHHHLDICKEECAELIKELSKETRDKGNRYDTLQELADVIICVEYIKKYFGFTDELVGRAITVKLKNVEEEIDITGSYQ